MLEVKEIYKNFKSHKKGIVKAVQGISFNVKPGRIFGLLGPNGAGKTTTLRIIATLLSPSKGDVLYNGKSIYTEKIEHRKRLGFVSGNTGLYDRLKPEEIVQYFGQLTGIDKKTINDRFNDIVELLDMKSILNKHCGKMSTGEKQKVSIARMMITNPDILILDEPTLGLDVLTSKTIVDFINESKKRGKTIILSTHILSEAEYLCDDIGIIHEGKLIYNGTLAKIFTNYPQQSLENIFLNLIGA